MNKRNPRRLAVVLIVWASVMWGLSYFAGRSLAELALYLFL